MPGPADLMAAMKAKKQSGGPGGGLAAMLQARQFQQRTNGEQQQQQHSSDATKEPAEPMREGDSPFSYNESLEAFLFFAEGERATSFVPKLVPDQFDNNPDTDILVPLAPCVYRMCDYTLAKKEPVALKRCILKLGVLRCLVRECANLNSLLWHRLNTLDDNNNKNGNNTTTVGTIEEDELSKSRFMELLSNCGVYQKVLELILQRAGKVTDAVAQRMKETTTTTTTSSSDENNSISNNKNPLRIPQVRVEAMDDFLAMIEKLVPALQQARDEIDKDQTVSFYPGLGELFSPGSMLLCHPEGMEGSPLGCSCVQSWYAEELNKATNKIKRRFVLVVEFVVSVGDELVFVAASDVYPEFHDLSRNQPIKDLTHRRLLPDTNADDAELLRRLQQRGEFYASVSAKNHYLEYYPDSFFPIIGGGWNSNAVRPLSKGGRVMVDVKRGILEGHLPIRGSSDGMSDTVKEAIKLFEQSKRTGIAVPFRTALLPGFGSSSAAAAAVRGDSDRHLLWQAWPMLTGFSFTARVWGKLLLGMPKPTKAANGDMDRRPPSRRMGVEQAALGGEGSCGNCGYITFQEKAFEQLVLAEDKKELIRAVARNAGGASEEYDGDRDDDDDDDDDDVEDFGIDVVANKGGASIFLLHGPPGCGKTLTAEAISELLRKPLYIVTAGDLGITASEVEKTLGSVLDLCQTWDALVLIDEADVFLEARTSTEIQRNALVCVMLRLLEYYTGCLFLSSNRSASSIDAAIASRITVMLGYPPLDAAGRAKVWKNLIELVPPQPIDPTTGQPSEKSKHPRRAAKYRINFTEEDYANLGARYQLNGRQIKNSIVLARALARERGSPLAMPVLHRAVTAVAGKDASLE